MAIDLKYDTEELIQAAKDYDKVADELEKMAKELQRLLEELKNTGWTTPAGTAFEDMTNTNWVLNINKYVDLLRTLKTALEEAAGQYDSLSTEQIQKTEILSEA